MRQKEKSEAPEQGTCLDPFSYKAGHRKNLSPPFRKSSFGIRARFKQWPETKEVSRKREDASGPRLQIQRGVSVHVPFENRLVLVTP